MALLDDVRDTFFLKSTATDATLTLHINAAIAELRRAGIRPELIAEETMDPLVKEFIVCFCHTRYDPTGSISQHWVNAFTMVEIQMMNSDMSTYLFEGDFGGTSGGLGSSLGSGLGATAGDG